ncbi:MAG: helix-turn-helix transcriptional regulator [Lachnospiraceae bacterium]|nr:helix-turn-helix transcriptional regulator [Lachnospiraceae bacterium]
MLSQRIKELRIEHNYSQTYIAKHLGISRSAYSMYESGVRNPDCNTVTKLADMYNVSTDYILGRSDCRFRCCQNMLWYRGC